MIKEQTLQFCLIDDRNTKRMRLVELGARLRAGQHVAGLFRNGAAHTTARHLDQGLRRLARKRRQGSGQNESLTGQRTDGLVSALSSSGSVLFRPDDTGSAQPVDDLPVMRLGKKVDDGRSDDRPDVADLLQRRRIGR